MLGSMKSPSTLSKGTLVAVAALCAFGLLGGWLILLSGGFHHMPSRFSRETTFVGGAPALFMAAIFFTLAFIALAALLQAINSSRYWYFLLGGILMVPPLLFCLR